MNNPLISIIIVNYNGKHWFEKCVKSIRMQTYRSVEVIVVDNASSDGSVAYVEKEFPEIQIVKSQKNNGFGVSNNIGVGHAKGQEILFLNNDTYFDENFLEILVGFKSRHRANIVGPKILDFEKEDHCKGRFLSIDVYGYAGFEYAPKPFYVEGCSLMISKADFLKLRGFDDKYFMYSEDIDLCWRALMAGMTIEVCDNAVLHHFGGGSSENTRLEKKTTHVVPYFRRYEVEKNNLRNVLKNYRLINLLWVLPGFLLISFFEAMFYLATGNIKAAILIGKAVFWNIANIADTLNERAELQKSRSTGDSEIMKKMTGFIPNKLKGLLLVGIPKFR